MKRKIDADQLLEPYEHCVAYYTMVFPTIPGVVGGLALELSQFYGDQML